MSTNLNTLKARVRKEVDDCELKNDTYMDDSGILKNVNDMKQTLFLKAKLIDNLSLLMQKHEEWAERTMIKLKCTDCNTYHNPTDPCHVS